MKRALTPSETLVLSELAAAGRPGAMINVMAVLKETNYDVAFQTANELDAMDCIKIIYCSPSAGLINVELTLKGKSMVTSV